MSQQRAIVSFLQGAFWLRYQQESSRIPAEHASSHDKLTAYVETQVSDTEVFYNFDADLLPAEEPTCAPIAPTPSRIVKLPDPALFAKAPRVMMAEQMAMRKAQGLSTEGKPQSPRVSLTCANVTCGKVFERLQSHYQYALAQGNKKVYCSKVCGLSVKKLPDSVELECEHCKQKFQRPRRNLNKGGKIAFCSSEHKSQYYRQEARHNARKEQGNKV